MIAFDSPEGTRLRGMQMSRSGLTSIWAAAVEEGRGDWLAWARQELASHVSAEDMAAMGFVLAAIEGEPRRAQQLWAVLATIPNGGRESRFLRAARELRASLPF